MAATVSGIHGGLDTHANRPAGNTVPDGSLYSCSTHGLIYKSNLAGNSWATYATLGASSSVATDPIWDAKGDLAGGTGADTAAKLTVGANDLSLVADSTQSTGLRWGVPILPNSTADSSADVNLSADTPADATSVSLTLTGTYLLLGYATLSHAGATQYGICYVTNSSNTVIAEGRMTVFSNSPQTIAAVPVIVTASSTTYKIRGQMGSTTSAKILRYSEGTAIGTRLIAIRLA